MKKTRFTDEQMVTILREADRELEIDVLKEITRSVRPPRVRRALGGAVDLGLPVAAGGAGCHGAGDEAASFLVRHHGRLYVH